MSHVLKTPDVKQPKSGEKQLNGPKSLFKTNRASLLCAIHTIVVLHIDVFDQYV